MLALLLIAVAVVIILWLARVPIATRFIDRSFAANGVPARYQIEDLGFQRQRLTNVVIGDPKDPDLVADWVETGMSVAGGQPVLSAVRAGQVRLRGTLVDGRLSLGALDRLMPAPSGQPFALPSIDLAVEDARMRLTTPLGVVGLKLRGRGRLDDGFRGTLAAVTPTLSVAGCDLRRPTALLSITVRDAAPTITGPVRLRSIACPGVTVAAPQARVDVAFGAALDRWRGAAALRTRAVNSRDLRVGSLDGLINFQGDGRRTEGDAQVRAEMLNGAGGATGPGSGAATGIAGRAALFVGQWRVAAGRALAAGRIEGHDLVLGAASRARLVDAAAAAEGTPLAPLAASAARAAAAAVTDFDLAGEMALGTAAGLPLLTVRGLSLQARSGAAASFGDGDGLVIGDPAGMRADGTLRFGGGGLPSGRVDLAQARPGGDIQGTATLARYDSGAASLALSPAPFTVSSGGKVRLVTAATVSGPIGGAGSVSALRLLLDVRADPAGIVINPACAPARFQQLTLSGLRLEASRLRLCPADGALLRIANGTVRGGVQASDIRLAGTLGGSPLTLGVGDAGWRHAGSTFTLSDVSTRLGRPGSVTRLDFGRLAGSIGDDAVLAGVFADGAGQIGTVPLLLSRARGDWRFAANVLSASGAMQVTDAASTPRFNPLDARDLSLRLAGNAIEAQGTLFTPDKSVKVANVAISHALARGEGAARLTVPGITFGDSFQPEELTRLTFGVIADVRGAVRGEGRIAWSASGVTSSGTFGTDGTDLAAAFGPVSGIKGRVEFTDLLALESAPGQVATVAEINPGVAVTDGRIEYQLLRGLRVAVKEGRWPFAGGTLTLQPTLLDFSSLQPRRLTFSANGVEARPFLQQFEFKNLDATGVFDGELPMVFDQSGGRVSNGRLVVREGGGTIAYLGDLTEEDLGIWGNIAFQALRSLRYRSLELVMNGPLAGEMITEVRFAGVSQGEGARSNFLVRRLQRLPFVFNLRIKAPFRGLIDTAASFYDPRRLVERNLPALLEEQNKRAAPPTIQPPASENKR